MGRLRLGYTKSRTGCFRCKQRRVKCDESKPICKACARHGVSCTYPEPGTRLLTRSSSSATPHPGPLRVSTSSASPTESHGLDTQTASSTPPIDPGTPVPVPAIPAPGQDPQDWVTDLQLLHHYTTTTSLTFPALSLRNDPSIRRLWQIEVPNQAFGHPFLLHQLLSISASHLARLEPHNRKQWSLRASHHQSLALNGMQAALGQIGPVNCHALFAASSLLFMASLGAADPSRTEEFTVDALVDIFLLIKGVNIVLDSSREMIKNGPLSEFVTLRQGAEETPEVLTRVTHALEGLLLDLLESKDSLCSIIRAEVNRMLQAIKMSVERSRDPMYRMIAIWPIMMPDELVRLLRQRSQAALALLAYYCVVFRAAELEGYWFLEGWPRAVLKDIHRSMMPPWVRHSTVAMEWVGGKG